MPYQIHLFDASDNRVAILQEEILTSADLDLSMSAAPTLTISMPLSESKSSFISPLYYAKIYNDNAAAYEHSVFELVDPDIEDSESGLQIKATYQGVLTRLSDEHIDAYDTGSAGDTFTNVITAILAFQVNTPAITVGTLEPSPTIAIALESTDIYSALNSIRDAYGGWFEVDSLYRLNWYNDNTGDPMREIRRSKNLKSLKYTPQYSRVVNRVYAYGKGESTARINLTDAGEAHEYIEDAASQALYGVRAKKYIDKSITHPATLLAYAQRILAEYKTPPYQYSVDVVNLAEVADYDYSLESLSLDTRIRVIDDLLSVDVDTSIVSMSINLLAPEEISVELNTVKNDLSDLFGQVLSVQDIQSSVATQIGAGQVTVLGTFTVIDWASSGTTEIDGSNITTGSITLSTVNGGSGSIQSADYVADTSGWLIDSAGDAEFNDVIVRGTIGSGGALIIDGDLATSDGKFEIKTSGIQLKSTAGDTTYIDLVQDTAQIQIYDSGTQRVQITPNGTIRLDTDAGIPIDINSTSDNDCITVDLAVTNRRALVCVSNPGSAANSYATIHATNSYSGGYAIYAGGKIYATNQIVGNNGLEITGTSEFKSGLTITGDLTMGGDADINNVDTLNADVIDTTVITNTDGGSITVQDNLSLPSHYIYVARCYIGGVYYLYESGGDLYWNGTKLN